MQFISRNSSNGQATQSSVKYIVLSNTTNIYNTSNGFHNFEQAVMIKLDEGWKLAGGVSVSEKVFYQALYK